jgi:pullulanase/glycogen debranching enzyme
MFPAEVMALRKQQIKNFCCLLFLSNGTPMFRAGDEFMNTAFWEDLTFAVQEGGAKEWLRVVDTSLPSSSDFCETRATKALTSQSYRVKARSVVVLVKGYGYEARSIYLVMLAATALE